MPKEVPKKWPEIFFCFSLLALMLFKHFVDYIYRCIYDYVMEDNKKYVYGFLGIVILFFVWRYVTNPLVITVSGTGKVTVPATIAKLSATVVDTGDSVSALDASLKAKVSAVRLAMVNGGVNEKSLTQTQVQVTPLAAVVSGAKGYSATVTLSGQTADVSNVNILIVKLYEAGASLVSQPVVEVENQITLENEALKFAMKEADANAKFFGKLKWKMFKKVASVQQASSGNTAVATKVTEKDGIFGSSFEVAKAVSVVYYLW